MEYNGNSKKRQIVAALAVLIIVVAIVAAATAANNKKTPSTPVASTPKVSTPAAATPAPVDMAATATMATANDSGYKDGSYTATGMYESPGGEEGITITVALKNGVVTSTSAKAGGNDPTARQYQSDFIGGYKQKTVGKNIASLNLSRVSGSSLTSQGFNDAIANIKNQAKV